MKRRKILLKWAKRILIAVAVIMVLAVMFVYTFG